MTLFFSKPELLEGYRHARRDALAEIYRFYFHQVTTLVRRGFLVGSAQPLSVPGINDEDEQCEIIQETFFRAFSASARKNFNSQSPFRPYLLRILKNLMIDRLRKGGRETSFSMMLKRRGVGDIDTILTQNIPFPEEDPLETKEHATLLNATNQYVAGLDEPLQTFYQLRYRDGLPQEKVASQMGSTRKRVRILEDKLRRGLQEFLKEKGLLMLIRNR